MSKCSVWKYEINKDNIAPVWFMLTDISSNYKLIVNKSGLHPQWITGFSDAEASFGLDLYKNSSLRSGWQIQPSFRILLHKKDLSLCRPSPFGGRPKRNPKLFNLFREGIRSRILWSNFGKRRQCGIQGSFFNRNC